MLDIISTRIASSWPRYCPVGRLRRGPLPVMFVITSMPVGGAETLLANLVRGMDSRRLRPEIVCLKEPGPLGDLLKADFPVHSHLLAAKWDLRVLPRLVRLFRRRNAAAVITVGAGDKMFWGRLAAYIAGVPRIFSALHSTGWPDGVSWLNRRLTPITDGFIAVADAHAEHMSEVEGFPEDRVFKIRNGVDTNRFVPNDEVRERIRTSLGIAMDTPVVGIVAALRPEKNHAMFLRCARGVLSMLPNAKFLIVGDGPQRPEIEQTIKELKLDEAVLMLGTRHDTPDLLAAMDCFTLTSENEASPVSILEALSCQVPVIATRVGSVFESVVDGETGYLVDVNEDNSMIECIYTVLSEPRLARSLGRKGRELVVQQASLESMIRGYTELIESRYDALAASRNPSDRLTDRRRFPRIDTEEVRRPI